MLRRSPLAEQAADALLGRLAEGEWPVGAKLPGETTLAAQFGVGRSTVREAIRLLAGRGVLEPRQGAGVFVLATGAGDDWGSVLRRAEVRDVVEGRIAIETEAARHAAARRTPTDLRRIGAALAARSAAPDGEAYLDADVAFHRAIVAAARNAVLLELFDSFHPRLRLAMRAFAVPRHRTEADHDAHAAILDAIRRRDPDRAASLTRTHLDGLTPPRP